MNTIWHPHFPKVNDTKLHFPQMSLEVSRAFSFVLTTKIHLHRLSTALLGTALSSRSIPLPKAPETSPHQYHHDFLTCVLLCHLNSSSTISMPGFSNEFKEGLGRGHNAQLSKASLFPFDFQVTVYSASSHVQNFILEGLHPACKSAHACGHLCAVSHSFTRQILNSPLHSAGNILLQTKSIQHFQRLKPKEKWKNYACNTADMLFSFCFFLDSENQYRSFGMREFY